MAAHRTVMGPSLLALALLGAASASCKAEPDEPPATLETTSLAHYSELRDGDRLVRLFGGWTVQGDGPEAARSFVEENRATLELLDGVVVGDAVALDRDGDVIRLPLSFDGHPIYGGEVRVRILGSGANRRIVTVSVEQPSGFHAADQTITTEQAESTAAGDAREVTGTPALRWLSTGMVLGRPDDAKLAWRVPVRGPGALAPSVRWIDVADGNVLWDDDSVAHFDVHDADGNGDRLDVIIEQDTLTRLVYSGGNLVGGEDADAEATAANEIATQACNRMDTKFGESLPCDDFTIIVDVSSNPSGVSDPDDAYASCNPDDQGHCTDSILGFGPTTLTWETGRQTFEHELWHAFVDRVSPLPGTGEPAAVNESFADLNAIFATRPGDEWILGIGNPGEPDFQKERNVTNPSDTGHPAHIDQTVDIEIDSYEGAHANGVVLSHGMWRAVVTGGTVAGRNWAPIPYEQAERTLYLATTNGLGKTTTLRRAAENVAVECILTVVRADVEGDLGTPPHGLRAQHCGALVNGFAEVGLMEPDRDVDGLWDSIDPCPDTPNINHFWEFGAGDCDADAPMDASMPPEPDMGGGPTVQPYQPPPCDGPSVECPPIYSGEGVEMVLTDRTDNCLETDGSIDGTQTSARCAYVPADEDPLDLDSVSFVVIYEAGRINPGGGCIVDTDGNSHDEPTKEFPSADWRAWVRYSGTNGDEENLMRREFARGLLSQVEGLGLPCNLVDCPASFDDQGTSRTLSTTFEYYRIPVSRNHLGTLVSEARCAYEPSGSYVMRWAQEPEEELPCPDRVSTGAEIDSTEVQAKVSFPAPINPDRTAVAEGLFEQIRDRAKTCP